MAMAISMSSLAVIASFLSSLFFYISSIYVWMDGWCGPAVDDAVY